MAPSEVCKVCGYDDANAPQAAVPSTEVYSPGVLLFLNSNDAPSGTTKTEFEQALTEEAEHLASIDASIANVRLELAELIKQRARAECKIKDYKRILHPIRRLPADILSSIFLHVINEDLEEDEEQSSTDPTYVIWRLPLVSQQWRSVALSFCRLWSTIRIVLTEQLEKRTQFMLGMQLNRSGSHPLFVSIYAQSDNFASEHPLLQFLFPSSQRWEDLILCMPLASYKKLLPWITSFPRLDSLHVWFENFDGKIDSLKDSGITEIVLASPNIKSIYANPRLLPKLSIPSEQIEVFRCFSRPSASNCLEGLRTLSYLRLCEFGFYAESNETGGLTEVHLPHLHTLIIHTKNQKSKPIHLLKHLRLPALNYLDLKDLNSVDNLLLLLEQSQCRLTRLRLSSPNLNATDCIRVWKVTPSLTFLTLHCPEAYTNKFLESLHNTEPRLLPSLKFLEIIMEEDDLAPKWSPEVLLKFEEARPDVKFFDNVFL